MKLLFFLAEKFYWEPFSQTIPEAEVDPSPDGVDNGVIVFYHLENADLSPENKKSVFKKTLKHIKWLANKKNFKNIVLHSFTHLGGDSAPPDEARQWISELAERLESTGYTVKQTPFGWFCSWELKVLGESLAKVWKEF